MTAPLLGLSQRLPPANLAAEQALLGALLAGSGAYERVAAFLRPEHFADPAHARIYEAIARRAAAGQLADAVTLKAEFEHAGILEELGGVAYLAQLVTAMVSPTLAAEYGRAVLDCWARRAGIEAGADLVNGCFGQAEDADVRAALLAAQDRLYATMQALDGGAGAGPRPAADALAELMAEHDAAVARGGGLAGVTWGFPRLDRATGGLRRGRLYVLAARPAMGKTALAVSIAARAAASGARVLFVSAEMPAAAVMARVVAAVANLTVPAVENGVVIDKGSQQLRRLTAEEYGEMIRARRRIARLPLVIDDRAAPSVAQIRMAAQRVAARGGLDLVVIDYLGLLAPSAAARRAGNRVFEVSELSGACKELARALDLPVLLLSQLSRKVEDRDVKMPVMSDLRDSGTIEQDADLVAFLHRPEYYLERERPERKPNETDDKFAARDAAWAEALVRTKGVAHLGIAKQRQGPTMRIDLRFDRRAAWFREEDEPALPGLPEAE